MMMMMMMMRLLLLLLLLLRRYHDRDGQLEVEEASDNAPGIVELHTPVGVVHVVLYMYVPRKQMEDSSFCLMAA